MNEVGALINTNYEVIWWHVPPGRSAGHLSDDRTLWDKFWLHRESVLGFAHVHPGAGRPAPSSTDLSTFAAIEQGLGRRLLWPIIAADLTETEDEEDYDYRSAIEVYAYFTGTRYVAMPGYSARLAQASWVRQLRCVAESDWLQQMIPIVQATNAYERWTLHDLFSRSLPTL